MKRLILSLAFLTAVLAVSILGANLLESTYDKVTSAIEQGEDCIRIGDYETAEKYMKEAEKIYVKAETYLLAFVNHSTLDDIGVDIAQLAPFVEKGEEAELFSHTNAAKTSLKHLKNDMIISIRSLF